MRVDRTREQYGEGLDSLWCYIGAFGSLYSWYTFKELAEIKFDTVVKKFNDKSFARRA